MDGRGDSETSLQDLRAHIGRLDDHGLLTRITRPINKDTELMPLVRWQFRGLEETQRRGFLFNNVTDAKGRTYSGAVAAGIYASSHEIYGIGMGCLATEIRPRWLKAQATPLAPVMVADAPVHEEVHVGADLLEHGGIEEFPIPISTPGLDIGPYTTASNWITRDPDTGWINVGNYRGQVKAPDCFGMFISPRNHGWKHWDIARREGNDLEAALAIGGPPALTYASGSRIPYGLQEYDVAGSLMGEPLELVDCKTVDLTVPAHAELVVEGRISHQYVEPEAPFGEYTGYMGGRVFNAVFHVTAITHRKNPIFCAILSQMPPSESSLLKKVAQDANYLHHLRQNCNLPDVMNISFHDIAVDSFCVVQMRRCNQAVAWQALYAIAGRNAMVGKTVIAVDEDIDIDDMEAVIWALSYRMQPEADMHVLPHRSVGLDPSGAPPAAGATGDNTVQRHFGSAVLINAMRKWDYPPVSLPTKEHMEHARVIWEELQLPALNPRPPWHGYELGDWSDRDREEADWAVKGEHGRVGERAKGERRPPEDD